MMSSWHGGRAGRVTFREAFESGTARSGLAPPSRAACCSRCALAPGKPPDCARVVAATSPGSGRN
eukprot:scaffold196_cov371-Prasinococcus_capsulatus_cf.AAC.13